MLKEDALDSVLEVSAFVKVPQNVGFGVFVFVKVSQNG